MNQTAFSQIKVTFASKNKNIKVSRFKKDHQPEIASFNFATVNFGRLFDPLKNKKILLSQRIKSSHSQTLKTVTRLANEFDGKGFKLASKRFFYQQALAQIYWPMVQETWKRGINQTLALLLERGSILIGSFYNYPPGYFARITAKRLDFKSGEFGLGLTNLILPPQIAHFKRLHILEDCIATGDSIAGTLLCLKKKGIFFKEIEINAAVATQAGIDFLSKFLKYLGCKKIIFKTGGFCYLLDDHFYLRRTIEEGYKDESYYVGDMGEWSRKLPSKYNRLAWWNKNRLDYD